MAAPQMLPSGPQHRGRVDPGMQPEPPVFQGESRRDDAGGRLHGPIAVIHLAAAVVASRLVARLGQEAAVAIRDKGGGRRRDQRAARGDRHHPTRRQAQSAREQEAGRAAAQELPAQRHRTRP